MSHKVDGFDHINIYSKGQTELGRLLSNFADMEIATIDGKFASIEGYWYWLQCLRHPDHNVLREMSGYEAKKTGRELRSQVEESPSPDNPLFRLRITSALINKLMQHDELFELFMNNDLPFAHYYISESGKRVSGEGKWVIDIWTFIHKLLRNQL